VISAKLIHSSRNWEYQLSRILKAITVGAASTDSGRRLELGLSGSLGIARMSALQGIRVIQGLAPAPFCGLILA
jgi:hypothetical protein